MALKFRQLFDKYLISPNKFLPITYYTTRVRLLSSKSTEDVDPDTPIFDMKNPFTREKQKCLLCEHGIEANYKNVKLLSQFQSPYTGRIYGRHLTGLCKGQQERVEKEIKKAQVAGLMPIYNKDPSFLNDPQLFDPERPIRPHRF